MKAQTTECLILSRQLYVVSHKKTINSPPFRRHQ